MVQKIVYWASTGIVGLMLLTSLLYLTGNEQVVSGFAKAGYPQHLRIMLGIAKPAAGIILLLPGLALLKEWAYVGAGITWIMAVIAHTASGEGMQVAGVPLVLFILLVVSYVTRPPSRRLVFGQRREALG
jgi:DoxX-like family